ncbi:MAG: putative transcriptional regulator [Clostridiales bacterium]|nr:putative transcriptional regulator [Clostridiales bacterium]
MNKQFGDRLKELRIENGLTQEALAKKFNTGKSSISNYESNSRLPDANTIGKYANFFDVSVDYLLGCSNVRNPYSETKFETKAYHNLDMNGLPEEAIRQVEEYIELIKLKYNPDGTLKKKSD